MKKWLVFYTKSRHEKKVHGFLLKRGYEVFLPLQKVMRQWSDRKKKVEVPLFNSYIFVFESEDKIPTVLQTPGISWNIRHNNKPAVLREDEMNLIQRFMATGLFVETQAEQEFEKGDAVEIIDGPLKGMRGFVTRTDAGERFSVLLESIHQNMIITLDPVVLKKRVS
jgi:transcription termination/antitermination protein NusG